MALTEFRTYKLKDLLKIKNGKDHKALGNGSIPVYGSGGIMRYADSYLYDKASILLPRKGSLDNIQYCEVPFWTVDTIYYTEVNDNLCDVYYLYRYLSMLDLSRLDSGTGVPSMTFDSYYQIEVKLPTLEAQKQTASMLKALDSKIHINEQINRNLEAMAKQLYDYWFLQYEFPNDEGKPYKSSGGTLCTDEQTGRSIPSDWNSCKLSNIENVIVTGKTPSTQDETNFGDDVPFITIDDIRRNLFIYETERSLSTKGAETQRNKYLTPGSLCCSCIGTVGVIGFAGRKAQTNQQINSIDFQNEANREYLYFSLKLHFQYADAKTGNTFANMNKDEFCNIPIINPKAELVSLFHTRTCPLFKVIDNNIKEINALQKQRDQLLPLLINGQVSVTQLNSDLVACSTQSCDQK